MSNIFIKNGSIDMSLYENEKKVIHFNETASLAIARAIKSHLLKRNDKIKIRKYSFNKKIASRSLVLQIRKHQ